jgi:hypothetical protein
MKYALTALIILLYVHLEAQNAEPLINAEKAFGQSCLKLGIRDGFLAWVDSTGIQVTEKGPVNAQWLWTSIPAFDGIFSWSPSYAEMSISGDWGYTTGNYEHRSKTLQDTVNESGQYSTVWHRNSAGEWKYLIDFGNRHEHLLPDKKAYTISIAKFKSERDNDSAVMVGLDKLFTESLGKNPREAYAKYGSVFYLLNIPQHKLVKGIDDAMPIILSFSTSPAYHVSGIFISTGKDMAVIYGSVNEAGKSGSFMRIWRCEKDGWKIALEVIRIPTE